MLIFGPQIAEGSSIKNTVVAKGTTFPVGPDNPPDSGELFYRTDENKLYFYNGTGWLEVPDASAIVNGLWTENGSDIYRLSNVGIGTNNPLQELHVLAGAGFESDVRIAGNNGLSGYLDVFHNSGTTGLWSSSTQSMQLGTNGTARVHITSGGLVGIGTTDPGSHKVLIDSTNTLGLKVRSTASGSAAYLYLNNGTNEWDISCRGTATADPSKMLIRYNATTAMAFDTVGNVGIGLTAPTEKLHVEGNLRLGAGGGNRRIDIRDNTNTQTVNIDSSGNTYFNGGNVGIGTTSPSAKLQVTGGDLNMDKNHVDNVASLDIVSTTKANKYTIQYNDTDDSLDFIFS